MAALDVFEEEPLRDPSHPLLSMDNVLCTPHIGYVTQDTYRVFFTEALEDVEAWLRGEPVRVIN
jgi:D-3-phosphoglycerate dehydrogenase